MAASRDRAARDCGSRPDSAKITCHIAFMAPLAALGCLLGNWRFASNIGAPDAMHAEELLSCHGAALPPRARAVASRRATWCSIACCVDGTGMAQTRADDDKQARLSLGFLHLLGRVSSASIACPRFSLVPPGRSSISMVIAVIRRLGLPSGRRGCQRKTVRYSASTAAPSGHRGVRVRSTVLPRAKSP